MKGSDLGTRPIRRLLKRGAIDVIDVSERDEVSTPAGSRWLDGASVPPSHPIMPTLAEVLHELHRLQPQLAQRNVVRIGVFGSVARGEARPDSDIDILVELTVAGDLFDLVGIKLLLEEALGRRVDVVPIGGLKTDARETVLREVRYAA